MAVSLTTSVVVSSNWTNFKSNAITGNKSLAINYDDDGTVYTIFALDVQIGYICTIWKGTVPDGILNGGYSQSQNNTDKSDFENNYKTNANLGAVNGLTFGDVALSSVTTSAVRRTAYTEQTTNFTGSIVSSSASDAAAGTGARTVTVTYLDQNGMGPLTETVTLNGTNAVNFVNTNHCYIESIIVATVGSGASNAGTITLKTGAAGAGTTVGTINVGENRTFWAHHYVPFGKTNYFTSMSGTVNGGPGSFLIKTMQLNVANAVENQVTDTIRVTSQSPTTPRNYGSPIRTPGPARILGYTVSETTSALTYRLSFDYYDR